MNYTTEKSNEIKYEGKFFVYISQTTAIHAILMRLWLCVRVVLFYFSFIRKMVGMN